MGIYREIRKGPITLNGVEWPIDGGEINLVAEDDITIEPAPGTLEVRIGRDLNQIVQTLAGLQWPIDGGDISLVAEDDIEISVDPATQTITIGRAVIIEGEWQLPTFQNSWADLGAGLEPAAYYKSADGIVRLRGVVAGGTIADATTGAIFTLPPGFRPENRAVFAAMSEGVNEALETVTRAGRVDVLPTGEVRAVDAESNWLSLSQISFRAV